jgi:hypothetical protein
VSMDNIGACPLNKISNARGYFPVNLPFARNQIRLNAFLCGALMKLQIWVRGV